MPTRKTTATDPENIVNRVKDSGLVDDTANIVKKAASVLEEEVAKGILAAKEVQKRFTGTDGLSSENKNELVERFRKDAHDMADSLADLMTMAIATAETMISRMNEKTPAEGNDSTMTTVRKTTKRKTDK